MILAPGEASSGTRDLPRYMEPIIAGRDLRKSWAATLVFDHPASLLPPGDKVALVAPNGPGKATLSGLLQAEPAPALGDPALKPGLRKAYLRRSRTSRRRRSSGTSSP